jgi:hypothetical protein
MMGSHVVSGTKFTVEEQKLLEISKRKPPANVSGLMKFMSDGQHFTREEQMLQVHSIAVQRLAASIAKCKGIRGELQQARKAVEAPTGQDENLRIKHQMHKIKYAECLAYHTCPTRWQLYSTCWSNLSRVPLQDLKVISEARQLPLLCQSERQSLERCVGSLVSGAVRAASIQELQKNGILPVLTMNDDGDGAYD